MLHAHTDAEAYEENDRNEMKSLLRILTTTENREAWVERVSSDGHAPLAMRNSVTH